ncbi:hypothetical protein HZB58_03495 [Candidatus Gottesmanbacteria bacterium]|nr:hypothetical protein [Candidatus Gottesmanbacteria bacterium]
MKRLPFFYLVLIVIIGLPILLWAVASENTELRSRADSTITPTATPSATLTLTPTPTNSPPRCSGLSVSPGSGTKPLTVTFACAGYDPDNDITAAEFGFGGSEKRLVEKGAGQFGSITTTYTYTQAGTYHTTCRVRDNNQVFSNYPDYCKYSVVVTENALTPTPRRTPIPTPTVVTTEEPLIFFGNNNPTATPTMKPAVISPTATPAPVKAASWWTNEKIAQLVMMVIVSGITIIVALLLHGFFDKR